MQQHEAEGHPLWERQVQIEYGMLREGADKFRDRVANAEGAGGQRKQQMTRLTAVRGLITDWLPGCADDLKLWCRAMRVQRGPKPVSLPYLEAADPHVACLIALRTILDGMRTERRAVVALAREIGRELEHEMKVRLWEEQDPEGYHGLQEYLRRDKATSGHRRRVNIIKFNEAAREAVDWDRGHARWGMEVQYRVGAALIDVVMRHTGWFEVDEDPEHAYTGGKPSSPAIILRPKQGLKDWLRETLDAEELRSATLKPTVIPPKPWESTRGGGYWTPYVRAPRLIRFKASMEGQQENAADDYEALDMPLVYQAVNYAQSRAWRINGRVLDVAMEVFSRSLGLGAMPVEEELPEPVRPPDIDENPDAKRKWKRERKRIIQRNLRKLAEVEVAKFKLRVATEYREFEEVYFPHMLDFRGRVYPIPVHLQPQGDGLARGLLEFANGKPCTVESGAPGWLAVHLSGCFGVDKVSLEDRIEWVEQREELWRRIAADPLANVEWQAKGVDSPWQALAAIYEWVGWLDEGEEWITHQNCTVDGTCNGIQHLSALTLDEVSGRYVNLVPGDAPRDIYQLVADNLQEVFERIASAPGPNQGHALYWLGFKGSNTGRLPRSLTKRQVMVVPYGGTKDSFFTYTREWLDENDPPPEEGFDWEDPVQKDLAELRTARLVFGVMQMWDVVRATVRGGTEVMEWLQKNAGLAAQGDQPIFWKTPSGFVVRHFYGAVKSRQIRTMLDGQEHQLRLNETTDQLDKKAQLQGIAPNFVHSLDAAALHLTLVEADRVGLPAFSCIHDSYGTLAPDMWHLYAMLREAFVQVHEGAMLEAFRGACAAVKVGILMSERPDLDILDAGELAEGELYAVPAKGELDLDGVRRSDYFFS